MPPDRAPLVGPGPHVHFQAIDLATLDDGSLPRYDAAFLIGILHHVKSATPDIVRTLRSVTDRVIVLEPNGDNLMRKALEWTPSYRHAGEDSFRTKRVIEIFSDAGFGVHVHRRLNVFPNFTPASVYRLLAPFERHIEASPLWDALCTVNVFGFAGENTPRKTG